jgi:hypothetical protein
MSTARTACLLLFLSAGSAFAHPGHGKPGFLHAHTWAQLADWAANGALLLLVFFLLFAAGTAFLKLKSALGRKRP